MNELYHYGVKGMKWGKHRAGGLDNQMVSAGGGAVDLEELEEEIQKNEEAYSAQEGINRAIAGKESSSKFNKVFHEVIGRRNSDRYRRNIEVGKRKVEQAKAMYLQWTKTHGFVEQSDDDENALIAVMSMTPDDLAHHGIKGQKWGIRRFQPYQPGARVKGGKEVGLATKVQQKIKGSITEHQKRRQEKKIAKAEAKESKKQARLDKKAANYEAEKQKAIKTGTVEDLVKFKGDLTPQQYSEAFIRLQNEKRLDDLVAANKKSGWETVEKGIAIVERFGKYANTLATAKESFDRFDNAIHKKEKEERKERKEKAKNAALSSITTLDDLNKAQKDHNLTADEYSKGLKILQSKAAGRKAYDDDTFGPKIKPKDDDSERKPTNDIRKNASYDNSDPSDFEAPKRPYDKTPKSVREKAGYTNPDGERGFEGAAEAGKRAIKGFNTSSSPSKYSSTTLRFGEETVRRLYQNNDNYSNLVKSVRKTVTDTQTESARQKEVDKKRRS
jgi:hypothetical protein